jgi:hypothetical protein
MPVASISAAARGSRHDSSLFTLFVDTEMIFAYPNVAHAEEITTLKRVNSTAPTQGIDQHWAEQSGHKVNSWTTIANRIFYQMVSG